MQIVFSILLVDVKDNYEYFCHKYKASNKLKSQLRFFANNYIKHNEEKNFLKKDFKKNIYNLGKKKIKLLIKFIYCVELKFSTQLLSNLLKEVDKTKIPIFPFNGQYLIKRGLTEGKKIGFPTCNIDI